MPSMIADPKARLPKKERGKHRWIVLASFVISDEAAHAANEGGDQPAILDNENMWDISIGCIDCEEPYNMIRAIPCPAREWKPDA